MLQLAFNNRYFGFFISLFIVEFLIGKYLHDDFVRPYVGDFLIVILLYCLLKSFVKIPVKPSVIAVLLISYVVEALQYINVLDLIGLRNSTAANILLGNYFSWWDILAYSLGAMFIIAIEPNTRSTTLEKQLFI
ncbi:DUF2809 domain-containing protein [Desertivirga arenae]|uniref:ribosomal maturation YjgA family protein n=1 Tax=Desertivirga arenae TaxID=2810309 RepID=UPI001A96C47A|nr:DUF2809 domain-containing protein [Pedobacter sp. SYSU D00823]